MWHLREPGERVETAFGLRVVDDLPGNHEAALVGTTKGHAECSLPSQPRRQHAQLAAHGRPHLRLYDGALVGCEGYLQACGHVEATVLHGELAGHRADSVHGGAARFGNHGDVVAVAVLQLLDCEVEVEGVGRPLLARAHQVQGPSEGRRLDPLHGIESDGLDALLHGLQQVHGRRGRGWLRDERGGGLGAWQLERERARCPRVAIRRGDREGGRHVAPETQSLPVRDQH
mmetsp:Transcript_12744/g.37099  ORF Transcript_12744/g.37099 Transcript_12744/m.37099 type:complete len:230 (+) Transcript_12744:282-971(+)